ncbi:hypothetical protein JVU11DRAFT_3871 [Chiua virens]|nr:hypothetical protein JVU11DRAFT_3871 [Chiua virens]
MLATFPVPILSITADAVRDLQGQDTLYGLWTVFTKCKESVHDGRRLENISWRLWYRELTQAQGLYHPPIPEIVTPHPKDERFQRSSYFPPHPSEKVSPPHVLSSGLPSPSDQASPSPLPSPMPTMIPPSTPERPRISPHVPASTSSCVRGKPSPRVGRLIVDMLSNQFSPPQRKPNTASLSTMAVLSTPPPTLQPPRSCEPNVPLVQLPATPEGPFPRVIVVNPTPHPTPPTTPILHDDTPGAPQPPSTFLLPPLPPPALRPPVPAAETQAQQQSRPSCLLMPREPPLPHTSARNTDAGSLARQDRRFFLQQSPEDASPERGDGSTASGKSPSDLFDASSVASSQMKSIMTDMDVDHSKKEDHLEDEEEEDEDDRRSATAASTGARQSTHGRQNKPKRGKEVGKRPLMKRSHSAKHVPPSIVRKLSAQQQPPQSERAEKKGAMFNIGSGSSNGSRSANGSTGKAPAKTTSLMNGFTTIQPSKVSPPKAPPPVMPKGFVNGRVPAGKVVPNGDAKANAAGNVNGNVNGNANANAQSRKTIVVANTSSEYETTDGEDSEEWASEEMDTGDKAREAEETRLREAALEVQRQRDLFAKVPKRSYSNLNRTQSGLLSQLMNPNPTIFPSNHPYRITRSSADISRQYQQPQAPVPQRSTSAYAPPRLSTTKSAAAVPMAAQITAISSSRPPSSAVKRQESEKNGYRPKGPPKEQEMEDDSGDDADDKIQMSQSVAQQRLQALISRRSLEQSTSTRVIQPVAVEVGPGVASTMTAPIPLGHPYNLPAAAPPMTPRTTRRRMLKTELSESMRRQLLWERQVSSNTNPALTARRTSQGMSGLRPLSTTTSSQGISEGRPSEAQDKEERRRRAMARNRSWADDYHYSGW